MDGGAGEDVDRSTGGPLGRRPDQQPASGWFGVPRTATDQARDAALAEDARRREHERFRLRQGRRRRTRQLVGVLVAAVFLGGIGLVGWWSARRVPDTAAAVRMVPEDRPRADVHAAEVEVTEYPSVAEDRERTPLGTPANVTGTGAHGFLRTGAGGKPVAYDPCRPIHVVVDARERPAGAEGLLEEALAEVGRATGLSFELDGDTEEVPSTRREPFQEERYGDRWAPVLVSWSDPSTVPDLGGPVLGFAGSQAVSRDGSPEVYVTGQLVLDRLDLGEFLAAEGGRATVRAVLEHELGHLVGLDHVGDPQELMAPEAHPGVTSFGPGDLEGLAALGRGPCVPTL